MALTYHVTNLDQSRKLYELGFDKPSIYYWTIPEWKYVEEFMKYNPAYENDGASPRVAQLTDNPDFYGIYWEPVTKVWAYLLSEIMQLLPSPIIKDRDWQKDRCFPTLLKNPDEYDMSYSIEFDGGEAKICVDKNPVTAACDLLIWCIENWFISTK